MCGCKRRGMPLGSASVLWRAPLVPGTVNHARAQVVPQRVTTDDDDQGDVRDHLMERHRRVSLDLMGDPATWDDMHRMEHLEAAMGLLRVDHRH
jgi:hypothetical protein